MAAPARERAWVGLGANLGDRGATLAAAVAALRQLPGTQGLRCSRLYRSAPLEARGPDFLNAVAAFDTALAPLDLLDALQAIEAAHGRERPYRNAPRTLDLDLLMLGDRTCATPRLTLPHPRLHRRAFVLRPLLDLAPGLSVPGLGPLSDHLAACADQAIECLPGAQAAGS